ncbi:hypothetical protein [Lactobacillus jensenii]|uniref:Uncharacterized protein n=1 Tax=Lactobacillus jensenii TaxID=109790 RepID=A0A5N1ICH6_LACJE|nr:hypothetical protein [Lactobacillus jensenii]WEB31229.1 hypothetical protein PUW59_02655 [Lactobacillus mulieris]EEX26686.1 hypothetical protein HMPREF0527_01525 [Lactobacillus jensenii SJ-7A-US]KAA9322969.1 hypothetical protein F6H94_04235 [Lactobacillus jensenii]MCZ3725553.1 hypothetical protein [Lactobacillus jensenii]MCZ3727320.1 hypothetical protein [Lactobacillus jensenii]
MRLLQVWKEKQAVTYQDLINTILRRWHKRITADGAFKVWCITVTLLAVISILCMVFLVQNPDLPWDHNL